MTFGSSYQEVRTLGTRGFLARSGQKYFALWVSIYRHDGYQKPRTKNLWHPG